MDSPQRPYGLRVVAVAAVVLGLLLRAVPLLARPERPLRTCDGRAYHELAVQLAQGSGLTISDPQVVVACGGVVSLGPSHHFAPGLAAVEAAFVAFMGDTPMALVLPLIVLSWLAVGVAWWATRDLFGSHAALLVAAAVALEWTGVYYGTFLGYSENLVLIALVMSLWAVIRGLREDRFIATAGAFAGLGYLTKASIGWFFLVAGIGGVVYRLLFRGPRVLLSRWYWTGALLFAIPVAVWSLRNLAQFWDGSLLGLVDAWQTSEINSRLIGDAVRQPGALAAGVLLKAPLLAFFLVVPVAPFWHSLAASLGNWREEDAFGLWLAVGLIFTIGVLFAAAFWVGDQRTTLWADPVRYVTPAQVPLLWLVLRSRSDSGRAWLVSVLILAVSCLVLPPLTGPGFPFGP